MSLKQEYLLNPDHQIGVITKLFRQKYSEIKYVSASSKQELF